VRKNIRTHVGVNSFYRREDGTEMTHDEVFGKVVEDIGLERITPFMPATKEEVRKALEEDRHLNSIPLEQWNVAHHNPGFRSLFRRLGIESLSISDSICTLKQAAKMWAEEESDNE
jgi:hypothetical protein